MRDVPEQFFHERIPIAAFLLFLPCVLVFGCTAPMTSGENPGSTVPSNVDLISNSLSDVVEKLLDEVPTSLEGRVYLVSLDSGNSFGGLAEDVLIRCLTERDSQVIISSDAGSSGSSGISEPDSIGPGAGSGTKPDRSDFNLQYRVVSMGMHYFPAGGGGLFGREKVERVAFVELFLRLQQRESGEIIWARSERGGRKHLIDRALIPYVERNDEFRGELTEEEESFLSRIWEPAFISGIVLGLIYLFYTNKTSD